MSWKLLRRSWRSRRRLSSPKRQNSNLREMNWNLNIMYCQQRIKSWFRNFPRRRRWSLRWTAIKKTWSSCSSPRSRRVMPCSGRLPTGFRKPSPVWRMPKWSTITSLSRQSTKCVRLFHWCSVHWHWWYRIRMKKKICPPNYFRLIVIHLLCRTLPISWSEPAGQTMSPIICASPVTTWWKYPGRYATCL